MVRNHLLRVVLLLLMSVGGLGIFGVTATAAQTCPTSAEWGTHTIQRGDTLFSLARRYDTTVTTLQTGNCLTNTLIYAGRALRVPNASTPMPGDGPLIDIQQPISGVTLGLNQPFTVSGQARALFEGNLVLQFLDPRGRIIIEQPVTAGGNVATGGTGPWSASVTLNVPDGTPVTLNAIAASARDGRTVAFDTISLRFAGDAGGISCTPQTSNVQHVVQRGENLYRIGLRYGVPFGEVARFNCLDNPGRISVGQRLYIP